ncbi:unnamed protein product [Peniophora sp. CBMAI 1063]|nr:unnamed protein product [Peniophora sp. CBMAI 1063]
MAVDPTYPLYPIACLLASAMLLLVLLTSLGRQRVNLGVAFLCFWLFLETLTLGINTIIWSDNADIKLYVYCDIVSHVQMITSVVKPMATLIITRRLHLISNLRSMHPTKAASGCSVWESLFWLQDLSESTSMLRMSPRALSPLEDYVVQELRFQVDEGFGCTNASDNSILSILLVRSWTVVIPMVSIIIYSLHVTRVFYRHSREMNYFFQGNNSVTRTSHFRILTLASVDILLTLPTGIVTIVLIVKDLLSVGPFPFYFGWTADHTDWQPQSFLYADTVSVGPFTVADFYFTYWTSPTLAFVIFALFGITSEARASYWRIIRTVGGWLGWKPTARAHSPLGEIEFSERPAQDSIFRPESNPSYINPNARAQDQDGHVGGVMGEAGIVSERDTIGEVRRSTVEEGYDERPTQPSAFSQAGFCNASA